MSRNRLSHAIVLGGSAAGLVAARVLSEHADRVTLVERDRLPQEAGHRKGTPQSRHANNLLPRAVGMLEAWFPGLTDELTAAGAVSVTDDARLVIRGIRYARTRGAPASLLLTRPVLDAALRARVRALPDVSVVDGCEATGLTADSAGDVIGVHVDDGTGERRLVADLVVDAMGRGSRARGWLATLGYEPPEGVEIRCGVHYATRLFARKPSDLAGDHLVLISPTVKNPRGAVAFAVEGDRWLVTLFAYDGVKPPLDLEAFRDFAATLDADDIGGLIATAEPVSEAAPFSYPSAVLRRYDRLRSVPEGYLVLGDSLCQLNPCYGQGLTSAALQAEALGRALRDRPRSLPRHYYGLAVAATSSAFDLSWSSDLDLPFVSGPPSPMPKPIRRYLKRAMAAAANDSVVSTAMRKVIGLVASPKSILAPKIALRVARRAIDAAPPRRTSGGALARSVPVAYADPEATRSRL